MQAWGLVGIGDCIIYACTLYTRRYVPNQADFYPIPATLLYLKTLPL